MDFQHRLYDLRKQASLSQEELANLLGVTRQAVQKWEAGSSRPDMDNLSALARYFNVTLDWLVTGQESAAAQPVPQTVINNYHSGWHYEYKSTRTLFGLPLVHVNIGQGIRRAKGIIAVGDIAAGVISLGGISVGALSAGGISLGVLSLGALSIGPLALGALSVGIIALGGISLGWLSLGGIAAGVYAVGAIADASSIAIGAIAGAPLAIGDEVSGAVTLLADGSVPRSAIQAAIEGQLGGSSWLSDLLTALAAHIHSTPLQ